MKIDHPIFRLEKFSWQLLCINLILKIPLKRIIQNPDKFLERRQFWTRISTKFKLCPDIKREVVTIGSSLQGEWISPLYAADLPVVLYLHGGGYIAGSIQTHRAYLSYFSSLTRTRVLAIDYRLAPEHPYPAALEDAMLTYTWLLNNGYESRKIFIAGESAGGGLALALILKLRDTRCVLPRACISLSPWADLTHSGKSFKYNAKSDIILNAPALPVAAQLYSQPHTLTDPYISPVYGRFHDLCPILIHVGSSELLLSDTLTLIDKIRYDNGQVTFEIWDKLFHAWHYSVGFLSEAQQAVQHIKNYIDQELKK